MRYERLYRRSALSKVPEMVKKPLSTTNPLRPLSYDEELGCLGAHDIVKHFDKLPVKPKLCIVGEPTSMKAITGHKGICDYDCIVHGKEAHSSLRALCRERGRERGGTGGLYEVRRAAHGELKALTINNSTRPSRQSTPVYHERRHGGEYRAEPLRVFFRNP